MELLLVAFNSCYHDQMLIPETKKLERWRALPCLLCMLIKVLWCCQVRIVVWVKAEGLNAGDIRAAPTTVSWGKYVTWAWTSLQTKKLKLTRQRLENKCITQSGTMSPLWAAASHLWLLTDTVDNYLARVRLNCRKPSGLGVMMLLQRYLVTRQFPYTKFTGFCSIQTRPDRKLGNKTVY